MRKVLMLAVLTCLLSSPASARDDVLMIPLSEVINMPEAEGKLDGSVRFYLAGQTTPKIIERMGTDVSNKKTNSVGKTDEFGCKWAALSALIAFQDKAKQLGANAVVDMVSYYKRKEVRDSVAFECHAGNIIVGTTLRGTYAKVAP